jgi:hypothetical protein
MTQTTNYFIIFSCLLYLKLVDKDKDKNKDIIKIFVSLVILYFVYQLFKENTRAESFVGTCNPHSPTPVYPPDCTRDNSSSPYCVNDSGLHPETAQNTKCICDNSKGWKTNSFGTNSDDLAGKCYCDPRAIAGEPPSCIDSVTCADWYAAEEAGPRSPACGAEIYAQERATDPMTVEPATHCCKPDPDNPRAPIDCGRYQCMKGGTVKEDRVPAGGTCSCVCPPDPVTGKVPTTPDCSDNPCLMPDESGYGNEFRKDDWGIKPELKQSNALPSPGFSATLKCKDRSSNDRTSYGSWPALFRWWEVTPVDVEYKCPASARPDNKLPIVSDDENPCNQPNWLSIIVLFVIIALAALALVGSGFRWKNRAAAGGDVAALAALGGAFGGPPPRPGGARAAAAAQRV